MSYLLEDPQILLEAAIGSIVALFLSFGLGYLAGFMATRYTRSLRLRTVSTMVWLLALGVGFPMGPLMDMII